MSDTLRPHGLQHARPPVHHQLPELTQPHVTKLVMPSSHLILCHPLLQFFRVDWLDLLAVQGTLKSLLQHHSSKALILWCSAFFIDQLSHPYMTTGKTIALTRWTIVGKVMFLLFIMLSRLVIAFLPRSHHLQGFWSPQNKVSNCFHCFPATYREVMGLDTVILAF